MGCIGSQTTACGDQVCPTGWDCDSLHQICIRPAQRTVCGDEGLVDGDPCSVGDTEGFHCDQGICIPGRCGDGVVDTTEECDLGPNNSDVLPDTCRTTCRLPKCGDGVVDASSFEACDDGPNNSDREPNACRNTCVLPRCGDGVVDTANGFDEVCDDGNATPGDGCSSDCKSLEECGNGIVDVGAGEQCDDGNTTAGDGCSPTCASEFCGNGIVDTDLGEVCDDGNTTGSDGCSPDCRSTEECGNGYIDSLRGETCDDGSTINGVEPNACRGDCQLTTCGDGYIGGVEVCEGNDLNGNACTTIGQGFTGGDLACDLNCQFDVSRCYDCGNGSCEESKGETPVNCRDDCGAVRVATGDEHTCVVLADGSARCWGKGNDGQLGDGSTPPFRDSSVRVSNLTSAIWIAAGGRHSCAVRSTGFARCWGHNLYGQLGDETNNPSPVPRTPKFDTTNLTDAVQIETGLFHSCVVRSGGEVACWGNGQQGQLGHGLDADSNFAVNMTNPLAMSDIGTGSFHTCALRPTGYIYCWGRGLLGQLGHGVNEDVNVRVQVGSGIGSTVNAIDVDAGGVSSCAVLETGAVMCWGSNTDYQLANPDPNAASNVPVAISGISDAASVAVGYGHIIVVRQNGQLIGWGDNSNGQCGTGSGTTHVTTPQPVVGLTHVKQAAGGGYHSCALLTYGGVRCWGDNNRGQLGNGSGQESNVPVVPTFFDDCSEQGIQLHEIASNTPDYFELINTGTCNYNLSGLTISWELGCDNSIQSYTFPANTRIAPGGVLRAVENALGTQPNEVSMGQGICDTPDDGGWVALCDGPCDLASCSNFLDYFEKSGNGSGQASAPSCAAMTGGALDVTGNSEDVLRTEFVGDKTTGALGDWSFGPGTRN